jgi:hypothetical protein
MNINKDQAIALLTQGLSTSVVAAAIGCDDSYISQLKADPDVQARIAQHQLELTEQDIAFDSKLERAESLALDKIERNMQFATLGQAMAAFRILNGAKKRRDALITPESGGTTINVNLTLPANSLPRYVTNAKSEIVEVEGKTMIGATAKSLDAILAARAGAHQLSLPQTTDLEKAAARLDTLAPPIAARPARRLPVGLSPDIL